MGRLDAMMYVLAAILQLAAMLFALWMAREAAYRRPWLVMFAALLLMFANRVLGTMTPRVQQFLSPFTALLVSATLLIALFAIRRLTVAERRSNLVTARIAAERDES